jgi:hypothetical protein
VRVKLQVADDWPSSLRLAFRRCYIPDDVLAQKAAEHGLSSSTVIATKLPDPGSVMAGDFGEIMMYLYHASRSYPTYTIGPKKWRLKQERTKPAPGSDVLNFVLPTWPQVSSEDQVLCTEVKTKSTNSDFRPISKAISGCEKDRVGRLSRTLTWLRERAITEALGETTLAHIERYTRATDYPPATKRFFAAAVVCESLVDAEITIDAPGTPSSEFEVIIISVPELHRIYNAVYAAVGADSANTNDTAERSSSA